MSNGDDDSTDTTNTTEPSETETDAAPTESDASASTDDEPNTETESSAVTPESLSERLDAIETALETATTESELDEIESDLDAVAADVETLPEPETEDEGEDGDDESDGEAADDLREQLQERIAELRETLEEQRGPYASDVIETLDSAGVTIAETKWTEQGRADIAVAVSSFLESANDALGTALVLDDESAESVKDVTDAITDAIDATKSATLDPDADADTIDVLLTAASDLQSDIHDAQQWSDLTVREQLGQLGFYDVLTPENRKDFPPELSVVRIAEANNDPETILLALDKLNSEFMEENCIDALCRMGPDAAFEAMNERAQKRSKDAIEVLGKIGDERALDTLLPYIEGEVDPALQKVTLKAIGEIGADDATQTVADRLVADDHEVRSAAGRALGRIGDTRAIKPLAETLTNDNNDSVRASAAWALNQIGTQPALERLREYSDDRSYIVQIEAERAEEALSDAEATRPA